MTSVHIDGQATATGDAYRALLAGSGAPVSPRDLPALLFEHAGLLHQVVRFDHLTLFLHDAARSAPTAALPAWGFRSNPRLVSFHAIRNSQGILDLRGGAPKATGPAQPLL